MSLSLQGSGAEPSLEDHFQRQSALIRSLNRWHAQWLQASSAPNLSLQDCGLVLSFSRSIQGQYLATLLHEAGGSLESGYCATPIEASLLVLGLLNPEKWYRL